MIVWKLYLQQAMQSFHITTNVVSSNPSSGTDRHDITEILLKVEINTITPPPSTPLHTKQYQSLTYLLRLCVFIHLNILYVYKSITYILVEEAS